MRQPALALFYYGPPFAWMAIIFALSTGAGSAEQTIGFLQRVQAAWFPAARFGPVQLEYINYALRKAGHVLEFLALSALGVRAFQFGRSRLRWQSVALALGLGVGYAALDELHQRFVPSRTAALTDWWIDSVGVVLGLTLTAGVFAIRSLEQSLRRRAGRERGE